MAEKTTSQHRTRSLRWLLAGLAGLLLACAGVALAVWLYFPQWLRERIIRAAAEQGYYLRFSGVGFSTSRLDLGDVEIRPLGGARWAVTAETATIFLTDWSPTSVALGSALLQSNLSVEALQEMLANEPQPSPAKSLPVDIDALRIRIGVEPWFEATTRELHLEGDRANAQLLAARFSELRFGSGALQVDGAKWEMDVALPGTAPEGSNSPRARVSAAITRDAKSYAIQGQFRLDPTSIGALPQQLRGAIPPATPVDVSGDFQFRYDLSPRRLREAKGTTAVVLRGFVPPHPVELQGFHFGDRTSVSTAWRYDVATSRALLSQLVIGAGALQLRGNGWLSPTLVGGEPHAIAHLELDAQLPCAAVAASALEARADSVFAHWAAEAARILTNGTVSIRAVVDTNTQKPESTTLRTGIGLGCGLKPLTGARLAALSRIPKLKDLPALFEGPLPLPQLKPPAVAAGPARVGEQPWLQWRLESQKGGQKLLMELPPSGQRH